jgi:hypothetical protein
MNKLSVCNIVNTYVSVMEKIEASLTKGEV